MALPDKHQLKFNSHKDVKKLMEAIEKRFVSAAASVSATFDKLPASPLPNVFQGFKKACVAEPQRRTIPVETSTSNALVSQCDGTRSYDWSYQAVKEPANFTLMAFSSSSSDNEVFTKAIFDCDNYYSSESDCESWPSSSLYDRFQPSGGYHAVLPPYTGTFMLPKLDLVFNTAPTAVESDHLAFNVQLSPTKMYKTCLTQLDLVHTVQQIKTTILAATPVPASPKSNSSGQRRNRKACFVYKSVDHLIKDYDFHTKKIAQPTQRNYAHRGHHKQYALFTHSKPQKHMVPTAVLSQSRPVSNTAVRPAPVVSAAQGKQRTWVWRPKCLILDHDFRTTIASMTLKQFDYNDTLGRSKSGVIDNGCSRYMTGNMSYLSEFEELNRGYVAFGGNPKGGKITGKGKIKTGKLDFDDVYFVKELRFNLFSVS
nr:ribonuclease H-like domain-containing protein [Tanacetum cinerariifolium]